MHSEEDPTLRIEHHLGFEEYHTMDHPRELLNQLGPGYGNFKDALVNRTLSGKNTIVFVGGIPDSYKSALIAQASLDIEEDDRIQRQRQNNGILLQQYYLEMRGVGSIAKKRAERFPEGTSILDSTFGHYSDAIYRDISQGATHLLLAAGVELEHPSVTWVEGTLLPGIINNQGQVEGIDKLLSTAHYFVQNADAMCVLMFASEHRRARGHQIKEAIRQAQSPEEVRQVLSNARMIDDRDPEAIRQYVLSHTGTEHSRRQSAESLYSITKKLIAEGRIAAPDFDLDHLDREEDYPFQQIGYWQGHFAPVWLSALFNGRYDNRGFALAAKDLGLNEEEIILDDSTRDLHIYGSVFDRDIIEILRQKREASDVGWRQQLFYSLGL